MAKIMCNILFFFLTLVGLCLAFTLTNAFTFVKTPQSVLATKRVVKFDKRCISSTTQEPACSRRSPLFFPPLEMGRAAAVRANTKAKTDARKAKINALYGKKIIVAVKAGGSPNPDANTLLKETIARAKANNVPVDVSAAP